MSCRIEFSLFLFFCLSTNRTQQEAEALEWQRRKNQPFEYIDFTIKPRQMFSVKGKKVNIFGFMGYVISVTTTT